METKLCVNILLNGKERICFVVCCFQYSALQLFIQSMTLYVVDYYVCGMKKRQFANCKYICSHMYAYSQGFRFVYFYRFLMWMYIVVSSKNLCTFLCNQQYEYILTLCLARDGSEAPPLSTRMNATSHVCVCVSSMCLRATSIAFHCSRTLAQ